MGNNPRESSIDDSATGAGLEPGETTTAAEEVNPANDKRSLDIGESGQFAPGGYYNQHGVTEAERLDLDEHTGKGTLDDTKP